MSMVEVRENLYWVGAQDPNLRVFDVVMRTEYGTSYNSYLLKTPKYRVLFETAKAKHFDTFLGHLREVCDPSELDYIVIDHTEPDHAGSLARLLDYASKARVLASPIALKFLGEICNRKIPGHGVDDDEIIELDTCKLRFLSVPLLHWPDSIYTYIEGMETLVTCDSFGCHYADDRVCNDLIEGDFVPAYKYYYDMIMGPFKPNVRYALERINDLKISTICPGHGPVLRENLDFYLNLYAEWSKEPEKEARSKPKVLVPFVSAYGYTEQLAHEITAGIKEEIDADVQLHDMVYADANKVQADMNDAEGILVGSPTINGDALPPVLDLVMKMNGVLHGGKVAGAFGSYGWSGEAADMLMNRLNTLRMKTVEPALKIPFNPQEPEKKAAARAYGKKFGRKLKDEWVKLRTAKSGKTYWKCVVCGEIFEGALPPDTCPVCGAGVEAFIEFFPEVITFHDDTALRVVIIGSGAGAVSAAVAVRKRNANAQIDLYSKEAALPYYRPILTQAMAQEIDDADFYMHPEHFYHDKRIQLHLNAEVTEIDKIAKTITVKGETIPYDKLVIATGATNFIPPTQGSTLPEVVAVREVQQVHKLKQLIGRESRKIAIIGGGLLGLEAASFLSEKGHTVTVFEAAPFILPRQMDAEGGALLRKIVKQSDVTLKLGIFVDEICGEEHVKSVKTNKDEFIDADIVIISSGIKSNTALAKRAGLEVERGIIVNEFMQTSHSDIYAVGDCANFNGRVDGIWETAIEQGNVAGAHLAGEKKTYVPKVFGATLHAFGTQLFSLGDLCKDENQEYQQVSMKNDLTGTYRKLFFREDKLVGGILLGDTRLTNPLLVGVSKQVSIEDAADNKLL